MTNQQLPEVSFNLDTLENKRNTQQFAREKIKGLQHYRILPPYGTNHGGSLFHKYSIHWGLTGPNGEAKPVQCSYFEDRYCPICDKVKKAQEELQRAKDVGASKDDVDELAKYIYGWKVKNQFLYNAVTMDGRVVILELTPTAHDELKAKIQEAVYKKGFDPTNLDSGVWFTFDRQGKGLDTVYKVDFKKIEVVHEGETLEKMDKTPISEDLVSKIKAQLAGRPGPMYDIHSFYEPRTAAELQGFLDGKPVVSKKAEAVKPASSAQAAQANNEQVMEQLPDFPVPPKASVDIDAEVELLRKLEQSVKS